MNSRLNLTSHSDDGACTQRGRRLDFSSAQQDRKFLWPRRAFFLEPGPVDATQVHTPAFRTLANQKPELTGKLKLLIERVERQREIYLSLREDLDNVDLPRFKAPELPRDHPSKAAHIARQWLGLVQNNTFDSYRAAVEARGVLVFRSNGYNGKWQIAKKSLILGFSLYDHDCPVIVVRKQDSESQ